MHAGERWRLGHRPGLDGLRGVAVLLVLVEHLFYAPVGHLGAIGVALFFALSGYLITGLLLDERARTGRIGLRGFYLRRAARLLPALLLMVSVSVVLLVAVGRPRVAVFSIPALGYFMNYFVGLSQNTVVVFGPTWSLAIEEHFYLIWPAALLLMLHRHWPLRRVLVVTLVGCIASAGWRMVLAGLDPPPHFVNADTLSRADGLLYGCAAALAVRIGWRPSARPLWAGLVMAAAAFPLHLPGYLSYSVLAVGSALVVVGLEAGALSAVFTWRPLVALGVISYGVYLWQDPIWFLWLAVTGLRWDSVWSLLPMVPVIVAVAWLSYRFVEKPIRDRVRGRVDQPRNWQATDAPATLSAPPVACSPSTSM